VCGFYILCVCVCFVISGCVFVGLVMCGCVCLSFVMRECVYVGVL